VEREIVANSLVLTESPAPGVCVVTLNRPDKRNALNIPLLEELVAAVERLNAQTDARVLVFTGAGPVFCAGLDLEEARDPQRAPRSGELIGKMLHGIVSSPHVTIAAVRGAAVAGGAGLMLACDLSVVASDFKTGFPEVRRGLVAGLVMTFLRRKLPEAKARELILLGELMGAEDARAAGMVNRVVAPEVVLPEALGLAKLALKGAPIALRRSKRLFDDLYHLPVNDHIDYATNLHKDMRTSPEAVEGLAAFAEKRLPKWDPDAR
jgi:methylglutaconyl-CoA hydratase